LEGFVHYNLLLCLKKILVLGGKIKNTKLLPQRTKKGRRKRLFESIAVVRQRNVSDKFDVFDIEDIVYKDISKAFARGTGKVPRMKGTSIELKEPKVFSSKEDINFIQLGTENKTPLSSTFTTNQLQKQILKKLPTLPPPRKSTTIKNSVQKTDTKINSIVGFSILGQQNKISTLTSQKGRSNSLSKDISKSSQFELIKQKEQPLLKEISKPAQKQISPQKEILKQAQEQKQAVKLVQKQLLKQLQKTPRGFILPREILLKPPRRPLIKFPKLKGKPQRKIPTPNRRFKDDLFYTPDFSARVLGITKKLSRKQIKSRAQEGDTLGVREIPIK